ncbi:cupredoxin domain-containing protein [Methanosphaerula palustris]|uniref:EfeO-type cupredoxin-like domain-containing protein n=1 Tax=Methanosphaerula palustris (strain ATCC BAA-1556 / DSM 19958 / E1-9c) TaxID=521011 RepID=B8GFH6_METPE|nr:cupredoxin domain-containing protein [Methanosphaerula palustris]ACL16024.1 hypothetical protein Mpal_0655 [Methanosphaerula palustris E1-9c]
MNSTTKAAIGIIIVAVIAIHILHCGGIATGSVQNTPTTGAAALQQSGSPNPTGVIGGNTSNSTDGGTETGQTKTIKLSYDGSQYSPAEIRVKQGTKVRIEGDPTTLQGCMLVVNIDTYGISKAIRSGDNVIEFTADRVGTFPIHCNMGIGNGKLIVESS